MKGRPKLARKRRQCAEISICRLCLVTLSIIIPPKEVFLCLVAPSIIIPQKKYSFAWGSPGHSHAGLLFANEEQKKVTSWFDWAFCHVCWPLIRLPHMLAFDPFATYAGLWSFWHIRWPLILLLHMLAFDPSATYAGLWSFCYICWPLKKKKIMMPLTQSAGHMMSVSTHGRVCVVIKYWFWTNRTRNWVNNSCGFS